MISDFWSKHPCSYMREFLRWRRAQATAIRFLDLFRSGKLVQRLGEVESGSLVLVYAADQDRERRHRLRKSELRVLQEAFPGVEFGP